MISSPRILVPDRRRLGSDIDAVLHDFASRRAEIAPLEIGATEPRYLLGCGLAGAHDGLQWRSGRYGPTEPAGRPGRDARPGTSTAEDAALTHVA